MRSKSQEVFSKYSSGKKKKFVGVTQVNLGGAGRGVAMSRIICNLLKLSQIIFVLVTPCGVLDYVCLHLCKLFNKVLDKPRAGMI